MSKLLVGIMFFTALLAGAPHGFASDNPTRLSGGRLIAAAKNRVQPEYPEEAKKVGVEGAVVVEIVIDTNGNVTSANAVSGHPLLRTAAEEAARQWTFEVTTVDGKAVEVVGTLTFNFMKD